MKHKPKFKCPFCHQDTSSSLTGKSVYFECLKCPVHIFFFMNDENTFLVRTVFSFNRNGKHYLWTNDHENNKCYLQKVNPEISSWPESCILELDDILPLTPANVLEKFSSYVAFL